MEITNQIVSYQEIEEGIVIDGDDYGIASYTIQPSIKDTFLSNPFLENKTSCMVYLARVDGVVGGREMFFPTKAIIGGEIVNSLSASSFMVEERFRSLALGADISMFPILNSGGSSVIIYAGISKMALPLYKKLKFYDLATPLMWQPRNTKFLFEMIGFKGVLLSVAKGFGNMVLKPYVKIANTIVSINSNKKISIAKLEEIPEWVNDIFSSDKHENKEYHNREWLQWVLTHNFFNREKDKQEFYAIYLNGKEYGFFLTKERESSIPDKNINRIVFGSIVEWGSLDENVLSEYDIYKMAIGTFSKDVDIVEFTSSDRKVIKKMRKFGFIKHGESHIAVKNLGKKNPSLGLIDNWRIRLGYGDVMFY